MKITMDFNEFKKAIERVNRVNTKGATLPIIESIHIAATQDITITKFNLETQVTANVLGDIQDQGTKLIPASTIKLISNIKNANTITIQDDQIHIDKKVIKYKDISTEEYPTIKLDSSILKFQLSEKELLRMLSCSYATATDETRPILTGICINQNEFVALNGFYLSIRHSNEFNSDLNITMGNDLWKTLIKLIDKKSDAIIKVYVAEKQIGDKTEQTKIRFEFPNFNIEGRLFEGDYIKYKSIIPAIEDSSTTIDIIDNNLQEKLKLFNTLESNSIVTKLNISDDNITINAADMENSLTDEIESSNKTGDNLLIAFNNKYLMETTKQYKESFKAYLTRDVSPMIITNNGYDLELVLPVKLSYAG